MCQFVAQGFLPLCLPPKAWAANGSVAATPGSLALFMRYSAVGLTSAKEGKVDRGGAL